MSLVDVCRLCLAKENLVWIFDTRFQSSENMKDVIYITTGVEIADTDIITQKICKKCCQVTIKMFEFRRTSIKNDRQLREQCRQILSEEPIKIPNTSVTIKNCVKKTLSEKPAENDKKEVKKELKPVYKIHPSVRELFQEYPQIKLPTVCLRSHIFPVVCMELDAVENYFKVRKMDIVEHTKLALKTGKVATKRTSAPARFKTPQPASSNRSPNTPRSENKDNRPPKPRIGPASKMAQRSSHPSVTQPKITPELPSKPNTSEGDRSVDRKTSLKAKSSRDVTPEEAPAVKKIKLSEDWETPKKDTPKQNVIESLGLVPKSTPTESPGILSYVANTSVPLHICNICNSVQYSAKELRKHQLKHLRCQFCKLKCKSLEQKRLHIESDCMIKNTMNNLPNVYLDKIEFNLQVRRKYPEAFLEFPVIKGMYDVENRPSGMESSDSEADDNPIGLDSPDDHEDIGFDDPEKLPLAVNPLRDSSVQDCKTPPKDSTSQEKTAPRKDSIAKPKPLSDDIIEIISDDEDEAPAPNAGASQNKLKEMLLAEKSVDRKLPLPPLIPIQKPVPVPAPPVEENIVYNTVSIVKPDIKIKGTTVLDNMDPRTTDIRVLRELLTIYKPVQLLVERQVQTELPSNRAITVNRSEMATELSCLKQQLHAYKVPVLIKNGSFNVSYSYQKQFARQKKLSLWNDLTPIDLKNTRVNLPVPSSANVSLPVPSSANVSLPVPSSANVSLPVSSSATVNVPVSSSANVSLLAPSSADVSLPVCSSANVTLPASSSANVNVLVSNSTNIDLPIPSSSIASLPVSSSVNAVTSQTGNGQNTVVILPSTATYNSSGVFCLPAQATATTPNYVCVTTPSVNSTFSNSVAPTANIVNMNPMLNNYLEVQNASAPAVVTAPILTTSHIDTNNGMPAGMIRVKNVWELT